MKRFHVCQSVDDIVLFKKKKLVQDDKSSPVRHLIRNVKSPAKSRKSISPGNKRGRMKGTRSTPRALVLPGVQKACSTAIKKMEQYN